MFVATFCKVGMLETVRGIHPCTVEKLACFSFQIASREATHPEPNEGQALDACCSQEKWLETTNRHNQGLEVLMAKRCYNLCARQEPRMGLMGKARSNQAIAPESSE